MFSDEKVKLLLVEEHPVSCKKDRPGDDLINRRDILEGANMVADDDVGTVLDKIFLTHDDDFFAKKSKPTQPVNGRFDSLQFPLESIHQTFPSYYLF